WPPVPTNARINDQGDRMIRKFLPAIAVAILGLACAPSAAQNTPQEAGMTAQYGGVMQSASNPVPGGLYWYDVVAAGGGGHRTTLTPVFETVVTYDFTKPD